MHEKILVAHTARSAIFVLIRVKPLLFSAPPRLRGEHSGFAAFANCEKNQLLS